MALTVNTNGAGIITIEGTRADIFSEGVGGLELHGSTGLNSSRTRVKDTFMSLLAKFNGRLVVIGGCYYKQHNNRRLHFNIDVYSFPVPHTGQGDMSYISFFYRWVQASKFRPQDADGFKFYLLNINN